MKRLLDECRQAFASGASSRGGFLGLFKKSAGGRDYQRDCGADDDVGLSDEFQLLHAHGRVVWGAIAQANSALYAHGRHDLPANTVHSPDPYFDATPEELVELAGRVFAVKNTAPADADVARIAALITDELNRALDVPLPPQMTGGRRVFFTSTWVQRRHLPTGYLAARVFPLLVCPERTAQNMILPLRYWAPGLVARWRKSDRQIPDSVKDAPPESAAPWWRPLTWKEYAANPVRLTPGAASQVLASMRADPLPGAYLSVGVRVADDGGFEYLLDVMEGPPPRSAFRTESHGVAVVVTPHSATYLLGTEIDYRTDPAGRGFVFNNPNAQRR